MPCIILLTESRHAPWLSFPKATMKAWPNGNWCTLRASNASAGTADPGRRRNDRGKAHPKSSPRAFSDGPGPDLCIEPRHERRPVIMSATAEAPHGPRCKGTLAILHGSSSRVADGRRACAASSEAQAPAFERESSRDSSADPNAVSNNL